MTYAVGLAVVAVAPDDVALALGVDAEPAPARPGMRHRDLLGRGRDATPREWTRIESALKADGRGLRVDPGDVVVVSPAGSGDMALTRRTPPDWRARVPGGVVVDGWDAAGPAGVLVSVALRVRAEAAPAAPVGPATP